MLESTTSAVMLPEGLRKRVAAVLVGPRGRLFRALGHNAELHSWLVANQPFPSFPSRYDLYQHIQSQIVEGAPIDFLEFGVSRGHSLLKWAELNVHPATRLIGFDTFEGLPESWDNITAVAPEGAYSTGGVTPTTDDPRVQFVVGLFNATLRGFLADFQVQSRLVIHNDSDLFSSTLYTLATIDPILVPGSILIFDEFANPMHEWRAFSDYLAAFGRSFTVLGASGPYYTQVALQVTEDKRSK